MGLFTEISGLSESLSEKRYPIFAEAGGKGAEIPSFGGVPKMSDDENLSPEDVLSKRHRKEKKELQVN